MKIHRKWDEGQTTGQDIIDDILAAKKASEKSEDEMASLPPELAKKTTGRIKEAVEMGDVFQIKSIAESLASESESFSPVSSKLIQLAEDFDFDGILNLARDLEK